VRMADRRTGIDVAGQGTSSPLTSSEHRDSDELIRRRRRAHRALVRARVGRSAHDRAVCHRGGYPPVARDRLWQRRSPAAPLRSVPPAPSRCSV
jgi:hypothetical protein